MRSAFFAAVTILALSACGGGKSVPDAGLSGAYTASACWVDEQLIISGIESHNDQSANMVQLGLFVADCGDGRYVLKVRPGCLVGLSLGADGTGTVIPGYPCAFQSSRGSEEHRTLGGTVSRGDGGTLNFDLDLKLVLDQGPAVPKGGGAGTWHFQRATRMGPTSTPTEGCDLMPSTAPDDFSAIIPCSEPDYVDGTTADTSREVRFSPDAGVGNKVVPRCLKILAGQRVRWIGDFVNFPLAPGMPGMLDVGSGPNPMLAKWGYQSAFHDETFDYPGDFIFHTGPLTSMSGLIRVQ